MYCNVINIFHTKFFYTGKQNTMDRIVETDIYMCGLSVIHAYSLFYSFKSSSIFISVLQRINS